MENTKRKHLNPFVVGLMQGFSTGGLIGGCAILAVGLWMHLWLLIIFGVLSAVFGHLGSIAWHD